LAPAGDARVTARGGDLYGRHCATCHGAHLEGQPGWQQPGPDGKLPAPPHDETGHSWGHSDEQLFRLTKYGVAEFAGPGYASAMPSFAGQLADDEIVAIIAFMKSRWPLGVRASQALLNPGFAGMPEGAEGSDWRFAPTCHPVPPAPRKS
jgi:mono/diheme cytochrome c family protein